MEQNNSSLALIENINIQAMQGTMTKINQFQGMMRSTLQQGHDFGIVPGTDKPTLLKPGAEKILMMLGLRSEFDIVDSTRDFEKGFFQYQVRCKLLHGDDVITEGLGACNTREPKYVKQNAYGIDNTVLKMAKKRALVDAALLVASLSDIFTQDIEDMDLNGDKVGSTPKTSFDSTETISKAQGKRMYALSHGNADLCKDIIAKFGYSSSEDVKKVDYNKICEEIEKAAAEVPEQ